MQGPGHARSRFRELEKLSSALLEVASYLNSGDGSDDLLQSFPALNNALAGQVTPIIPKQIKQDIRNWSSWTFLPFLKQLEAGNPFLIQGHDLTIEDR